jgi:hypothetical protein
MAPGRLARPVLQDYQGEREDAAVNKTSVFRIWIQDQVSGSGSRRAKVTHRNRGKKFRNFSLEVLDALF